MELGNKIVLSYMGRVRRDWHNKLKGDNGDDISIMNEDLMRDIVFEIQSSDQQKTKARVRIISDKPIHVLTTRFLCHSLLFTCVPLTICMITVLDCVLTGCVIGSLMWTSPPLILVVTTAMSHIPADVPHLCHAPG
jgi:hypothetical protein